MVSNLWALWESTQRGMTAMYDTVNGLLAFIAEHVTMHGGAPAVDCLLANAHVLRRKDGKTSMVRIGDCSPGDFLWGTLSGQDASLLLRLDEKTPVVKENVFELDLNWKGSGGDPKKRGKILLTESQAVPVVNTQAHLDGRGGIHLSRGRKTAKEQRKTDLGTPDSNQEAQDLSADAHNLLVTAIPEKKLNDVAFQVDMSEVRLRRGELKGCRERFGPFNCVDVTLSLVTGSSKDTAIFVHAEKDLWVAVNGSKHWFETSDAAAAAAAVDAGAASAPDCVSLDALDLEEARTPSELFYACEWELWNTPVASERRPWDVPV